MLEDHGTEEIGDVRPGLTDGVAQQEERRGGLAGRERGDHGTEMDADERDPLDAGTAAQLVGRRDRIGDAGRNGRLVEGAAAFAVAAVVESQDRVAGGGDIPPEDRHFRAHAHAFPPDRGHDHDPERRWLFRRTGARVEEAVAVGRLEEEVVFVRLRDG